MVVVDAHVVDIDVAVGRCGGGDSGGGGIVIDPVFPNIIGIVLVTALVAVAIIVVIAVVVGVVVAVVVAVAATLAVVAVLLSLLLCIIIFDAVAAALLLAVTTGVLVIEVSVVNGVFVIVEGKWFCGDSVLALGNLDNAFVIGLVLVV